MRIIVQSLFLSELQFTILLFCRNSGVRIIIRPVVVLPLNIPTLVLVHFTAASSVCVHFLLIQYSVPLLSQLQFPINEMV